jgi:hypothetical protein
MTEAKRKGIGAVEGNKEITSKVDTSSSGIAIIGQAMPHQAHMFTSSLTTSKTGRHRAG